MNLYNYDYKSNKLWTQDINLNHYDKNINPYELLKMIKDENKKINNNKYFYLFDSDSIFIIHKLNNILLVKPSNINLNKKIQYSNFLIIYLLRYISFLNTISYNVVHKILSQILLFIKPLKYKNINNKHSYNFCKYNYKCVSYYKKKKCDFDHCCYTKVSIDISNIINKIYKLDVDSLKKNIVTLHYVIEHIYNEFFMYRYINGD